MSNIEIAAFQSNLIEEWDDAELDDADLMAVVGGSGGVASELVTGVANVNNGIGNGGKPTTSLLTLGGNTLVGAGNYVLTVAGGAEQGLQALNATVSGTADQI
ncbi:hypothetical protein IQ264_19870 [Phormidium sp. LEGE 05292]|uniref:hypothetical protein n=1 Tax=[Phormidium] sp. LEGE 05292 TaxID=767427 RepID=UPI00187DDEA3|nr:hypothetical protein [Phormidium sp. LEGE 05292]MBE9227688.1 hypothetical protein [Phormidium sp. LEGE 05292]